MTDERRQLPPLELRENPLVFTLGQIVIAPVLRMGDYVAQIQEKFRRAGFPRFGEVDTQQIRIQNQQPEIVADKRWVFATRDNRSAVVLSTNFVVLEQTTYTTFEDFLGLLAKAVTTVSEVVGVDFCERFGFRRINLVETADSGLSLREFFKPGLRGLDPEALGLERVEARLEERGVTPAGTLVLRLTKGAPGQALPPDVMPTTLEHREPSTTGHHALLDIDHYSTQPRDFTESAVIDGFWDLHRFSDAAFRAAVTEAALAFWQRGTRS